MTQLLEKKYDSIGESFYKGKLTNGLDVIFIPKKGIKEQFGLLSVNFGALDTQSVKDTASFYPEGIAHFLEHKLFELDNQVDVTQLFSELGADTNAFTTFERTCYHISTFENLDKSLELLLSFPQTATFSKESVEKEREIIGQEIDMYHDDADYRLYQGILENLYPHTAMAIDIAGNRESLNQISLEMLHENHALYYQPNNMTLLIIGDRVPESIYQEINHISKQLPLANQKQPIRNHDLNHFPVTKTRITQMVISMPKLSVGYRGNRLEKKESVLKQELSLQLFFNMLLGWTSDFYQTLYETKVIDDSFEFELSVQESYQFLIMMLDTNEPIAMSTRLRRYLADIDAIADLSVEHFDLVKKELYGDFIKSLDSVEKLAVQFITYLRKDETYFDIPKIMEELTFEDVINKGRQFLKDAEVSDFIILPK